MPYSPPVTISVAAFWHREERRWSISGYIHDPTSTTEPEPLVCGEYGPFDAWPDVAGDIHPMLDKLAEMAQHRT